MFLRVIKGFNVMVITGARATVHAILVAALFVFASELMRTILSLDLKSFLLWLLMATVFAFLFGVLLLIHGAREVLFITLLSESNQSSRELSERVLTPIAFALGSLLLGSLLVSRPGGLRWLGLAIGYFLAPTLIRKRLLARLLESLGPA